LSNYYVEEGCPRIVTLATCAAAVLIGRVYEFNHVGGGLHIVVDDENLDDECITDCLKAIREGRFHGDKPSEEQIDAEFRCAEALLQLTLEERLSALALHDGMLRPDGSLAPYVEQWRANWERRF
jgi:hypothetical protein